MLRRIYLAGIAVLFLVASAASNVQAQSQSIDDTGLWTALFAQGDIDRVGNGRMKWWFDGHVRLLDDATGFNQSIVRPGLGWGLGENSALWAGYGWIHTSPLNGADFDEHRIWQQWTWSKSCKPLKLSFLALKLRLPQHST